MTLGCSPVPQPRFIERSEANDRGGMLGAVLRDAEASGLYTKERPGFDEATTKKMVGYLENMLPMDFNALTDYYRKNKWIMRDIAATTKAQAAGMPDVVYKGTKDIDEVGMAAAVTKTYLESVGGGIKQMADNFIRKVNAGENATLEGLQFAQQMQGLSRFGGYVLGWDQGYGRAMRTQMLRSDGWAQGADRALDNVADKLGNMGKYEDKFQEIAMKLQDPLTKVDGVNELINLAKRVQFLENPTDIVKVSTSMHIAGNAWSEVFVNGMLSGPATFAANASGAAWTVMRPMLQLGAAKAYAMSGLPGARIAEEAAAEAAAALAAMQSGFNDAARLGWRAFRTESTLYQAGAMDGAERFGISGARLEELAANMGKDEPPDAVIDLANKIGRWVRLPSRALLGTDEFAKHLSIRGEVAAQAIKRAAGEGVDLGDKAVMQEYLHNEMKQAFNMASPELWKKYQLKSSYSLMNKVQAEADRATFQEANSLAKSTSELLGKMPFLKPFVPFVRTPLNILNQGFVESTGVGAIINAYKAGSEVGFNPTAMKMAIAKKLLDDPGETFRVSGQIALMSAVAATFYTGAMNGMIIGGGPGRWSSGGRASNEQRAWERMMNEQGKVPYSLNLADGTSIPFSRLPEPVAGFMRMFADMGMNSAWVNHESQEEWLTAMTVIGVSGLYNSSFLKGINDIVDLMGDPSATTGVKGGRAIQNWMATQTPFGGLLSYVDQTQDPFKHAYGGATLGEVMKVHEDTFGTGIFAKIADRIPGFNGTPGLVDQISGQPVPMTPGQGPGGLNPLQAAIPFLPRGHKGADSAWSAIYNIAGSYKEFTPTNFKLTNAEQQDLNKRMATTVINGKTVQQAVLDYYNRPDVQAYVRKKGATFADVRTGIEEGLRSTIREYYLAGLESLMQSNRSINQRAVLANGIGEYSRNNDFETAQQMKTQLDSLFEEARVRGVF